MSLGLETAPTERAGAQAPAAVVFDMDGLLLDSERLAREAFLAACAELRVEPELEAYGRCVGTSQADTREILAGAFGGRVSMAELEACWNAAYAARLEAAPVPVKPGARDLLAALTAAGVSRGLATSTARPLATAKLQRAGLLSYFSCLICGGETPRGKPHPDPYLAALAALRSPPAVSWALEDSDNGVRSAHAAGLTVFHVPDLIPPGAEVRALGHRVVADLGEVLEAFHRCRR